MLETGKFYFQTNCAKDLTNFPMMDYVFTLVRNTEYKKVQDNKNWKEGKKTLENSHANIDVMTCEESLIHQTLGNDAGEFIKRRNEIVALKEEVDKCLPLDKVTSLDPVDRVHVTLAAHTIFRAVVLDADIFDPEKGGVDIAPAIQAYYNSGKQKDTKDILRSQFNKLLGTESEHFYAIRTKRTDFATKELGNFLAAFGGKAGREKSKKEVDGKKVVVYGNYNWRDNSAKVKTQIASFTELCAVVVDNASKITVDAPEGVTVEKRTFQKA